MTMHQKLERPVRVKLTVGDFMLLDAGGAFSGYARTELIDGVVIAMNAQFRPHAFAKSELAFRIRDSLRLVGSDLAVVIEGSVRIDPVSVPIPDITITAQPRGDGAIPIESCLLIIEVADSTLPFDSGKKAAVYAGAGVPEYWIVDLAGRRVLRLTEPKRRRYRAMDAVAFGDPLGSLTIAGLAVSSDGLA